MNFAWVTKIGGEKLMLPIRPQPDGVHGLASFIVNQASFAVQNKLADLLATQLAAFRPAVVVGRVAPPST